MPNAISELCGKHLTAGLLAAALIAGPSSVAMAESDGVIDELRLGLLNHEMSLLRDTSEEDGVDINGEILFTTPDWLEWMAAPRPHLGVTAATHDDATSFVYGGLTWDWNFWGPAFVEGSFGFAVHDGETDPNPGGTANELGCRVNFHESASIGYEVTEHHRVMLTTEHVSNASICDENEGLTNIGFRYGYRF